VLRDFARKTDVNSRNSIEFYFIIFMAKSTTTMQWDVEKDICVVTCDKIDECNAVTDNIIILYCIQMNISYVTYIKRYITLYSVH
jgi:hypothetical protein